MRAERGFVLVATLWVLALVAVVAVFFAERMGQARALALAAQARNQALLDLSGARADMLYRLATTPVSLYGLGQDPATALALDDRPYRSLGDTLVQVQDNRGLLNLNVVDDERLGRFLGVLGVPPERRSALIDALRDYADEDNLKRLNGAEAAEYAAAGLPPPRNAKLVAPLEARRVYGWAQAPELWKDDVLHGLTTTGTSFSMNPNTAPWQVLAAMRNMTPEGVQAIMAARKLAPIVGPQQVVALTGVQISTDPMLADVVALPADSWRVTQQAPGMGWGWRYNVSLTPVSDFAPWRIDYFYRVELPAQNVHPQAPSRLPERPASPAVAAPGLFPTP
jgi:type II secretory pathway component PulK